MAGAGFYSCFWAVLVPWRPGSLMASEEGDSKMSENVGILVPGAPIL